MPVPAWAKPLGQAPADPAPAGLPEWARPLDDSAIMPDEQPLNFGERVAADFQDRAQTVEDMIIRQANGSVLKGIAEAPTIGALALGQGAGLAADVVGQGLQSAYQTIVPQGAREAISGAIGKAANILPQPGTPAALLADPFMVRPAIKTGQELYGGLKELAPDAALALEGTANLAAIGAGGKGVAGAAASRARQAPERLAKEYSAVVEKGIEKAIRPGVEGKRTYGQYRQYMSSAERAVGTIINNKQALQLTDEAGEVVAGALPKNLKQFSQAIHQTKADIYRQYDELAKSAGASGAKVDLKPIAKELDVITRSKPLRDNAPEVVAYAKSRAEALRKRGAYSTTDAQEAISILNNSLESFYKNPSYETASRAYIDSLVVNNMRKSLDNVIEKATAPGYQDLKRDYGALKAIERDVNRRAVVDARKNTKGLIDFTDVFSGGAVTHGLIGLNPALVGQGAAMKGISGIIKHLNDPNRHVKNLFAKAEKIKANQ